MLKRSLATISLLIFSLLIYGQPNSSGSHIVYHTDFNTVDGWDEDDIPDYNRVSGKLKATIADGKLRLAGIETNTVVRKSLFLGLDYSRDFFIETSITPFGDKANNTEYAVFFGDDGRQRNVLSLHSDGLYMFYSFLPGSVKHHISSSVGVTVKPYGAYNKLRIEKVGEIYSGFINGEKIGQATEIENFGRNIGIEFNKGDISIDYFTVGYLTGNASKEMDVISQNPTNDPNLIYHSDFNKTDGWEKDHGEVRDWNRKSGDLEINAEGGKLLMGGDRNYARYQKINLFSC